MLFGSYSPRFLQSKAQILAIALLSLLMLSLEAFVPETEPTSSDTSLTIVSFSQTLGLADLQLETSRADLQSVAVTIQTRQGAQSQTSAIRIVLQRSSSTPSHWQGRLFLGKPADELACQVIMTTTTGLQESSNFDLAFESSTVQTPDWAKGAIWYSILPERFANANPANDPMSNLVIPKAWDAAWEDPGDDEIQRYWSISSANPKLAPRTGSRPVWTSSIFFRRYGGDLQGIQSHLDWLKSLSVDAIYLLPIFQSPSLHKYDATDFRHIDPTLAAPQAQDPQVLGPDQWQWTPADNYFINEFLPSVHKKGMRVVLDAVWDHVSVDHWAFQDVLSQDINSQYADWFDVAFDDAGRLDHWFGWPHRRNGHMPKARQTAAGDFTPAYKEHIFRITRRWMDPDDDGDPSDGIDGWRLDVAGEVGQTFWRDWRKLVKSINPDAVIIAELWNDAGSSLDGSSFDGQMNYPFAYPVTRWLDGDSRPDVGKELAQVYNHHPAVDLVQLNLLSSHDTERLASRLMNPGRGFDQQAGTNALLDGTYDRSEPDLPARDRSALAAALLATWPGAPMIFYGQEIAMAGADDPDNRRPMPWHALSDQKNETAPPQTLHPLSTYQYWLSLRKDPSLSPVLRYGDLNLVLTPDPDLLIFTRSLNDTLVIVALNRSDQTKDIKAFMPEILTRDLSLPDHPPVRWIAQPQYRVGCGYPQPLVSWLVAPRSARLWKNP